MRQPRGATAHGEATAVKLGGFSAPTQDVSGARLYRVSQKSIVILHQGSLAAFSIRPFKKVASCGLSLRILSWNMAGSPFAHASSQG